VATNPAMASIGMLICAVDDAALEGKVAALAAPPTASIPSLPVLSVPVLVLLVVGEPLEVIRIECSAGERQPTR